MTSNLGSEIIRDRMEKWKNNMPEKEEELLRNEICYVAEKITQTRIPEQGR